MRTPGAGPGREPGDQRLGTALTARATLADLSEQALLVETLGYDSVWLPEIAGRDVFVTAAVLAERTEDLRVATGAVPLPSRGLPALAMAACAVAELAPRRFVLGLGAGHAETATARYGWAGVASLRQMESALVALARAFRDGRLTDDAGSRPVDLQLDGTHVTVPPALVVAGLRPRMCELAGRVADGLLLNWATVPQVRAAADIAVAAAGGRAFEVACYLPVAVTSDLPAARAAVARQLLPYLRLRAYGQALADAGHADDVHLVRTDHRSRAGQAALARLIEAVALVGDAGTVAAGLERYRQAGLTLPVIAPVTWGEESADVLAQTWAALAPFG